MKTENKTTFSQQVKIEVCENTKLSFCCFSAACYGLVCFAKYFDNKGLVIHTEHLFLAEYIKTLFEKIDLRGKIELRLNGSYEYAIKESAEIEKMLVYFDTTGQEPSMRIKSDFFVCENCFAHFISSAFLLGGTVTNPEKGYRLEFSTSKYNLSQDFFALLENQGFQPKKTKRKNNYITYFHLSEQIEDLLVSMGAHKSAFEIMNLKVYKEIRNNANRVANSEAANIQKSIEATQKHLSNIAKLEQANLLTALPVDLQVIANLRKIYPEYSLGELGLLCEPPLSKSGVSHRLKKIEEAANSLQERKQNA